MVSSSLVNISDKDGTLFKIDNSIYWNMTNLQKIVYKMESLIETKCKNDIP
jgi:hypothetical protein